MPALRVQIPQVLAYRIILRKLECEPQKDSERETISKSLLVILGKAVAFRAARLTEVQATRAAPEDAAGDRCAWFANKGPDM